MQSYTLFSWRSCHSGRFRAIAEHFTDLAIGDLVIIDYRFIVSSFIVSSSRFPQMFHNRAHLAWREGLALGLVLHALQIIPQR